MAETIVRVYLMAVYVHEHVFGWMPPGGKRKFIGGGVSIAWMC